jgi:hypothetical protein
MKWILPPFTTALDEERSRFPCIRLGLPCPHVRHRNEIETMNFIATIVSKIWKVFDRIRWLNYGKPAIIVSLTVGRISSTVSVGRLY